MKLKMARTVLRMDSVTLFLLACGLAMDAFAVSLSNGLCYHNLRRSQAALSAVTFGIFQAIMPVIGYFAGRFFSEAISSVDPVSSTHLDVYKRQPLCQATERRLWD